jgi:hypothetical protein
VPVDVVAEVHTLDGLVDALVSSLGGDGGQGTGR